MNFKNWEIESTGGGNYCLFKELTTKNGEIALMYISEMGASIPLNEDDSFQSLAKFQDEFTENFLDIVDYMVEDENYQISIEAYVHFTVEQIEEIVEACNHLDHLYEIGF